MSSDRIPREIELRISLHETNIFDMVIEEDLSFSLVPGKGFIGSRI